MFRIVIEDRSLAEVLDQLYMHVSQIEGFEVKPSILVPIEKESVPAGKNPEPEKPKKPRKPRASKKALPAAATEATPETETPAEPEVQLPALMQAVGAYAKAADENPNVIRKFLADCEATKLSELSEGNRALLMGLVS